MKNYRCSVSWRMVGGCDVRAESLEAARKRIQEDMPLEAFNADDDYGSFEIDELEESEVQDEEEEESE